MQRDSEIDRLGELLRDVFPGPRFSNEYLTWLYDKSPEGAPIATDHVEDGKVLGHYAMVPQTWRAGNEVRRMALALNLAVSPRSRRRALAGIFARLAKTTHETARQAGIEAVIAITNANSTPAAVRRVGFMPLMPLPVVAGLVLPVRTRGGQSIAVERRFIEKPEFQAFCASIDDASETGHGQAWPPEKLAWRLSSPLTQYCIHEGRTGFLVSCASDFKGVRIVIALKFFRLKGARVIDVRHLLALAARFHHTPLFLYAGFNQYAKISGIPVPRGLLPSPLNLIYYRLSQSMPSASDLRFGTFEFFDFDAY